ncbi:hypothetical protein PR048_029765 [Dryococelus australis]|uniref:Endonuclease/exonuclease/phosphatase domain-containing protein n=1 Tax=Dryococelus australis TaxID=614101 RepID=A0ABQ9G723_9NEOP|nr:hypothetical protein PR048_029765 [Dryococelus australis]
MFQEQYVLHRKVMGFPGVLLTSDENPKAAIWIYKPYRNKILDSLHNIEMVIATDVNTKSQMWYSPETDDKEIIVEQFIMARDLCICNTACNMAIYMSPAHDKKTYIDGSASDHQIILVVVRLTEILENKSVVQRPRYTHRAANLKRFDDLLLAEAEGHNDIEDPQERADKTTASIEYTCD